MGDPLRKSILADELIAAARRWRAALIPGTSTVPWRDAKQLVDALDRYDCEHERATRIHHADGRRDCGTCGAALADEAPTPIPEPVL